MKRLLPCLAALIVSAAAGDLEGERVWTGANGKTLRGTYVRTLEDGAKVEIRMSTGKLQVIALENLSGGDRQLVEKENRGGMGGLLRDLTKKGGAGLREKVDELTGGEADALAEEISERVEKEVDRAKEFLGGKDPEDEPRRTGTGPFARFKAEPHVDRKGIPVINQGEFGNKASDCVPSAFCNFLLWWDEIGYLEIPKRGDFEDKAEWIHSRIARYCGTRNTAGTSVDEAREGFAKYFEKDIGDLAAHRCFRDHDLRPENLARYTTGTDATMLEVTIRRPPGRDSGHWVALVEAWPDGTLVFNTWGMRFEGRMKPLEKSSETVTVGRQLVPATTYEIEIINPDDLPDAYKNQETRFILDPRNWDGVVVVRPYRYREEGKPAALPGDPTLPKLEPEAP